MNKEQRLREIEEELARRRAASASPPPQAPSAKAGEGLTNPLTVLAGKPISGKSIKETVVPALTEGGLATAGQVAGAAFPPPLNLAAVPILGGTGGAAGNAIGSFAVGKTPTRGELAAAFIANMVPGANLAGAPVKTIAKKGVQFAAANLAAKAEQVALDEGRVLSPAEASLATASGVAAAVVSSKIGNGELAANAAMTKSQKSLRDETIRLAMNEGYILDPSLANPTAANTLVDRVIGLGQMQRSMVFKNQEITNKIARREIGLAQDAPITAEAIIAQKHKASGPYREAAAISSAADDTLKTITKQRARANDYWRKYRLEHDPDIRDKAVEAAELAEKAEIALEQIATNAGNPSLVDRIRDARKLLSKIHVVEGALNTSDGNVAPEIIGKVYDAKKRNLTDGLEVIARLQNTMPQVMKEQAVTQAAGDPSFRSIFLGAAMAGGYKMGGVPGAAAAGGAVLFGPAQLRKLAMSPKYQQFMVPPRYDTTRPDNLAAFSRFATQAAGRNVPSFALPRKEDKK